MSGRPSVTLSTPFHLAIIDHLLENRGSIDMAMWSRICTRGSKCWVLGLGTGTIPVAIAIAVAAGMRLLDAGACPSRVLVLVAGACSSRVLVLAPVLVFPDVAPVVALDRFS